MLTELVYCSVATRIMTPDDLRDLLEVAREKNARLNVTGILLYSNLTREFVQMLEGERDVVEELMAVIANDERHTSVDVMFQGEIEQRSFKDWSMAFRRLEELDPELLEGCTTFVADALPASSLEGRNSRARTVMSSLSATL